MLDLFRNYYHSFENLWNPCQTYNKYYLGD